MVTTCERIGDVPAYSSAEHLRSRVRGETDSFGDESSLITERRQSGRGIRVRETFLQRATQSEREGVALLRAYAM